MERENAMATGSRRRALVVDGSSIGRMLAALMLAERDFEVVEAEDAEAALARLEAGAFDLMLMDTGLPGMSGAVLCQKVRHELGRVEMPIIGYLAGDDLTAVARMRMAGINDFISKPVSTGALDQLLEHTFAH